MVTRPAHQSETICGRLRALGATVLLQPIVQITAANDAKGKLGIQDALRDFDWLVFLSANAVEHFLAALVREGSDLRCLSAHRIAAIGPATAGRLADYCLKADCLPPRSCSQSLAGALIAQAPSGAFLLLRGDQGRDTLASSLRQQGAKVGEMTLYRSISVPAVHPAIRRSMAEGKVDWTFVSSGQIACELVRHFGQDLHHTGLVTISSAVSRIVEGRGFSVSVEACEHTLEGMTQALLRHLANAPPAAQSKEMP